MKMCHLAVATTAALISHCAIAADRQPTIEDGAEAQAIRDAAIVREALQRLRAAGYAATPAGLKEFQQAKGLSPSGKLDQRTLAALGLSAAPTHAPHARWSAN